MNNNNNLLRKILLICKEVTNHEEFNNELTISVKPQKLLSLFDNLKKISIENKANNDELKHKQLSTDLRMSIQKARCSAGLTQKELAQKINVSHQIISDIESGKAIYNEQHINKLKRFLKI